MNSGDFGGHVLDVLLVILAVGLAMFVVVTSSIEIQKAPLRVLEKQVQVEQRKAFVVVTHDIGDAVAGWIRGDISDTE